MEEVKKWKFFDEMQFLASLSAKMLQRQLSATFHRNQLVHSCRFKFYSEKITVTNLDYCHSIYLSTAVSSHMFTNNTVMPVEH